MLSSHSRWLVPFLILILALGAISAVSAQDRLLPVFRFERVTVAQGLPTDATRSNVVTDRHGFAWVGTASGLVRYDGNSCKIYRNIPGDPHSISSNVATSLLVDSRGLLWIGTFTNGLSLYDAPNDRFVNFLPPGKDNALMGLGGILMISEDRAGNIWFSSPESMVVLADMSGLVNETNVDSIAARLRFKAFHLEASNGFVYLGDWDKESVLFGTTRGLFSYSHVTRQVSRLTLPPASGTSLDTVVIVAFQWESPERLWIATRSHGLYLFDRSVESLTAFHKRPPGGKESRDDLVIDAVIDRGGRLWIATKNALDLFELSSGTYREYLTYPIDPPSYPLLLSVDRMGRFWVTTTNDALYVLTPQSLQFPHYALKGRDGKPLSMETIDEADGGTYWIASEGKVLKMRMTDLKVLQTVDLFKGKRPVLDRAGVWDSYRDKAGAIWYGTWGLGLYRFDPLTGRVDNFRSSTQLAGLANKGDVCASIARGSGDSLWIAGYHDGLLQFDTRTNRFSQRSTVGGINLYYAMHVLKDKAGKLWISDEQQGVLVLDPTTGTVDHFTHDPSRPNSISDTKVRATYEAPDGNIWVAARQLNLWNPESRSFTQFPNSSFGGLESELPLGADTRGRLWIYYNIVGGVGVLTPGTRSFVNFDFLDGLCEGMYEMHNLPDGRSLLLGWGGMNIVHPESLSTVQSPPPLAITRMSINDSVNVTPRMRTAGTLELRHDQSVLEFEFAVIDPVAGLNIDPVVGQLVIYLYRLEGLEHTWVNSGGRRYVRYPGIAPGQYVFRVKASNRYNRWPDQEVALAISIAPPWWRTWWAYGIYGFLFFGILYAVYLARLSQLSLKRQAELERLQAEHLTEVDRLKSRFFTNISHEFRTPLTLILGPANHLLEQAQNEKTREELDIIHRSAKKLNRLVDELLDISRIEAGEMKLKARPIDLVALVNESLLSFHPLAETKNIKFGMHCDEKEMIVYLDKNKTDKILTNVLSNAFKFTPEGGRITVSVSLVASGTHPPHSPFSLKGKGDGLPVGQAGGVSSGFVTIAISDTGIGIPKDHIDKIFDRFYQVDGSHTREHGGTGIGLALTKELIALHKGAIEVESEEGKGSTFRLMFPLGKDHLGPEEIGEEDKKEGPDQKREAIVPHSDEYVERNHGRRIDTDVSNESELPSLLIVEDDPDVRKYISMILVNRYRITEAKDGEEGLRKSIEQIPDLIISDIMMPKLDGFELCERLKTDPRTSHIPVIMLTAKATMDDKVSGLERGADDYIMKPFEASELKARIKNLFEQRQRLHRYFRERGLFEIDDKTITSVDQKFLKRAVEVIHEHLSDTSFGVEAFAEKMAVSRSVLLRKIAALVGEAPSDLIKRTRLNKAAKLLGANSGNVSEVALEVGFSNPSYFAECFRKQFGVTPTQYSHNPQNPPHKQAGPR